MSFPASLSLLLSFPIEERRKEFVSRVMGTSLSSEKAPFFPPVFWSISQDVGAKLNLSCRGREKVNMGEKKHKPFIALVKVRLFQKMKLYPSSIPRRAQL